MTPQYPAWMEYGAIAALVGGGLFLWRSMVKTFVRKQDAESSLDARADSAVERVNELLTAEREALKDARADTSKANDRLAGVAEKFNDTLGKLLVAHTSQLETVKAEHRESLKHVHDRLDDQQRRADELEKMHRDCHLQLAALCTKFDVPHVSDLLLTRTLGRSA